ncbi:uncharacterized protein LOC131239003 [Magnolia sinica]|uniref:uncharacterized protein LOC131239003 n=1 Tax=Magnolia sinica TaxID=86752 RepID=UPI0026585BAB|nr:uncharacterized protein LOC131239003 [Magnolia sinica]
MGSDSGVSSREDSSNSDWNENEIAAATTAIAASAYVMGAAEYYSGYYLKSYGLEEQVIMFLHTIGYNVRNYVIGNWFSRSGEIVSRHFNGVLDAVIGLYPEYVKFSGLHTPKEISDNLMWSPYFQNVMVACTFDMKFVYVLAGWDGSASDARVLQNALTRHPDCFLVPHEKYYVVDAGYAHFSDFMAPYRACCVVHNFILIFGEDDFYEAVEDIRDSSEEISPSPIEVNDADEDRALSCLIDRTRDEWIRKMDQIAERMWNDSLPRTRQRY